MAAAAEARKRRIDYLVDELQAYKDITSAGKGLRHFVRGELHWWDKQQEAMQTVRLPINRTELWKRARSIKFRTKDREEILKSDWRKLRVIDSADHHLRIEDNQGRLLAYRLKIPGELTDQLAATEGIIPKGKITDHERATTINRHWGLWKKYDSEPRMSSEYRRDLPFSQQWFDANKPLFNHLSKVLRLLEPEMYVRYTSIKEFLPPDRFPTCGAWYACAINQNMVADGVPHFDLSDYYCGLNVVTGWGDYTSAKLALWQLGLALENKPGEAVLFLGRLITHNAVDIKGGRRNIVDAFVHQTPLQWKDSLFEEETGLTKRRRVVGKKDVKGKGKNTKLGAMVVEDDEEEMGAAAGAGTGTDDEFKVMYNNDMPGARSD